MSLSHIKTRLAAVLTAICFLWVAGRPDRPVWAQHAGPNHAGHEHGGQHPGATDQATAAQHGPHGGQLTAAQFLLFEVVYQPREIRVYLYDASRRPLTARGVRCLAAMRVRGHEKVFRYPLKYVTSSAGSRQQDCLALAIDISRIRDGDMTASFELANLPSRQEPQVRFTQTFALSKVPLKVTVVALTDADRVGVARQQVCPVSGKRLGGMGTPVKVLVGDRPLYLCCKGCLARLQKDPQTYLPKAPPAPQITITPATAADQAAIRAQRVCPVMNTPLGDHGTPLKVTIGGQALFLCCKGCLGKLRKNPDGYLAKVAQLRGGR